MFMSCAINIKSISSNQRITWSGTLLENNGEWFVITSFAPLAGVLPCKRLKKVGNHSHGSFSKTTVDANIYFQVTNCSVPMLKKCSVKSYFAWSCPNCASELEQLQYSIRLNEKEELNAACCSAHQSGIFLSWFMLLHITGDDSDIFNPHSAANRKHLQVSDLRQGMTVWTNSYPFGDASNTMFNGCVSKGVLCNILSNTVLLIDASCLPGSEGSAVYSEKLKLIGIVVSALVLKTDQTAGINVACSLQEIIQSLSRCIRKVNSKVPFHVQNTYKQLFDSHGPSAGSKEIRQVIDQPEVVYLHQGKGWGSGVVVAVDLSMGDGRIAIATCRHVVEAAKNRALKALFCRGTSDAMSLTANVVYSSKPAWLDFALLEAKCSIGQASHLLSVMKKYMKTDDNIIHFLKFAVRYEKGAEVLASGHCLFETEDYMPTLTEGVLANVVYPPKPFRLGRHLCPALLYSSCVVLDGTSGGALFSCQHCLFYGLIVNNVKQFCGEDKHILYPHVSFILPAILFMPAVLTYILKGNNAFTRLDAILSDTNLCNSWMLQDNNPIDFTSKHDTKSKL